MPEVYEDLRSVKNLLLFGGDFSGLRVEEA